MCADVGRGRQVDRYWHTLLGLAAAADLAETRLKLRNAIRTIELAAPRRGRTLEAPGRSR